MFQRKSPESAGPSQCIRNSSGRRPEEPCVLPAATVSCATILRGLPSHQITSCSGLRCCGSADGLPQTASSVITASQCPDSRRKIGLFASCCHASIGRRLCAQRGVVAGLHFSGFFGFPSGARRSITNPQAHQNSCRLAATNPTNPCRYHGKGHCRHVIAFQECTMYGHDAFARTDSGDTSDHILRIRLSAAGMIPG